MHSIGKAIKRVRTESKLSQEEFAKRINTRMGTSITKGMVSKWESDNAEPKISVIRAISATFSTSMDELLGTGEYAMNPQIKTIAAHIDDDATEDELEDIAKYIDFLKSQRK